MHNTLIPPPRTLSELMDCMRAACIHATGYAIGGRQVYDGFGLDQVSGRYRWYYTERGQISPLQYFETEAEAAGYAWEQIRADTWARTHCIGLTTDMAVAEALAAALQNRNVPFWQDEIPHYADGKSARRTFVTGCDVLAVQDLVEPPFLYPVT